MNAYGYSVGAFPHAPAPNSPYANMPFLGGDAFNGHIQHPYAYPSGPPGMPTPGTMPQQRQFGQFGTPSNPAVSSGALAGTPVMNNTIGANPYTGPGITPPFEMRGHGVPSNMYQQGWRVGNDGRWYSPGTSSGPANSYSPY